MRTLCIVGLGLMGGSLALALRSADPPTVRRIVGVSRNEATLDTALAVRAIDHGATDLAEGVAGADVVILAAPVRTILRQLPLVGEHARAGALVMDLGSTKAAICAAMAGMPDGVQPVGGHPMCGKEQGGFAAAEPLLYRDRPFVLCPLPRTSRAALDQAIELVTAVGARPEVLDPMEHDYAVAAISHLPYAAAVALVSVVFSGAGASSAAGGNGPSLLPWRLAATGFRDTTRLAASNEEMMLDILLTNRGPLLEWLERFGRQLAGLQRALAAGDEDELTRLIRSAQAIRRAL